MSDFANGISALMNPRRVLKKREEEAGLGMTVPESEKPAGSEKPTMSQADFFYGRKKEAAPAPAPAAKQGGPAAKDSSEQPKPRRTLRDMLRRRKAEETAAADDYESEWRKDTDAPLTDAMRTGRAKLAAESGAEDMAYRRAFRA